MTEQSCGPVAYRTIDISNVLDCRARGGTGPRRRQVAVVVLSTLEAGPRRFTELKRSITDTSQRVLTVTLRGLERDGILTRTVYAVMPPNVSYELTAIGKTLQEATHSLTRWSIANVAVVDAARAEFDHRADQAQ